MRCVLSCYTKILIANLLLFRDAVSALVSSRQSISGQSQGHAPIAIVATSTVAAMGHGSEQHKQIPTKSTMTRSSFLSTVAALVVVPSVAQASAKPPETISLSATEECSISSSIVTSAIELSALQESISGFFAGAALTTTKTVVKYPLDTATVRLQIPGSKYSLRTLFQDSYNGATLSLISNIPGGAIFFAVKDAVKASLKQKTVNGAPPPKWFTTSLAVAAAQIPYWAIRNPSEVVKVRQQAGMPGYGDGVSAWQAIQQTLADAAASENSTVLERGKEFYTGYWENVAYAYPADVIKFVAYEAITGGKKYLPPADGARAGAAATAIAQFVTTPLDVVRNRLMSGKKKHQTIDAKGNDDESYFGALATISREEGLAGLFAGASPRVGKAILSGAIQFATYEETKQQIAGLLLREKPDR